MTYSTSRNNGRKGSYEYRNSRLETLIEALDDLLESKPQAYTQRIALLHQALKDAYNARRDAADLLAFLYGPWSDE